MTANEKLVLRITSWLLIEFFTHAKSKSFNLFQKNEIANTCKELRFPAHKKHSNQQESIFPMISFRSFAATIAVIPCWSLRGLSSTISAPTIG